MIRICFVCLGNICRSPTAEAIMQKLISEAGLDTKIEVDSAGTAAYHSGENADPRSRETAKRHGVNIDQRARQFQQSDFENFDYVIAMDNSNLKSLLRLSTPSTAPKLQLLRAYDHTSEPTADVPDPYLEGHRGFEEVFEICLRSCQALLEKICSEHDLQRS